VKGRRVLGYESKTDPGQKSPVSNLFSLIVSVAMSVVLWVVAAVLVRVFLATAICFAAAAIVTTVGSFVQARAVLRE
jgi:hypothetical protein